MSKRQDRQRFIRHYKETTGEKELDMRKVAQFAKEMGWEMPKPPSEIDMLAKLFTEAAHEERKYDKGTGQPYRVYHAIPVSGQPSLFAYIDIDEANRRQMHMSSNIRREQMVSDGLNLVLDLDHWNSINPAEEPIQIPMDLTLDIEIRKAAAADDDDETG
ncbi:MAG: hypothetical protein Q8M24_15335 [Pseudolabrys sp.]|nr:hypothetical protein [Pseudolabrys sp.]MDP2296817.1 hypothetical protein [Pseudolabrys sp.]